MGKNRETLQSLSLSHRLFTKLRAQRNLADVKRRVGRLETRFYDVVTRWAHNIESKDAYTLGHCERVADYSCALARDVGFDEMTMFWFRIGALLHDVGKIVVPSEILNKPGPLSAEERRGHGAPRGSGQRPARRHRFSVGHSAARARTSRALGRARISGPARRRRHRVERAHRLRRRRVRRADDRSSLSPRVHARRSADDDGEGRRRRCSIPSSFRASSASFAR